MSEVRCGECPVFQDGGLSCEMSVLCNRWACLGPLVHHLVLLAPPECFTESLIWHVCLKILAVGTEGGAFSLNT